MDELTLDDELYLSTKRAAKITGYAKDYVGQLCREGRVKARLVGRNWYVLDSSIREHRFGAESGSAEALEKEPHGAAEAVTQDKPVVTEWNPVQYSTETTPEMVIIGNNIDVNVYEDPQMQPHVSENEPEEEAVDTSSVVKEMQSAWQDWFKRNEETKILEETLLESSEVIEERESEAGRHYSEFHSVNTATHLDTVEIKNNSNEDSWDIETDSPSESEVHDIEPEVSVSIHRTYREVEAPKEEYLPAYVRTTKRGRPLRARSVPNQGFYILSPLIKVICLLVILTSITIAVLGSGYMDIFVKRDSATLYPLQYLGGVSVLNKQ